MIIGIPKETMPNERRVAITPDVVPTYTSLGLKVHLEKGAGESAGFRDEEYKAKGAVIVDSRAEIFGSSEILAQVNTYANEPTAGADALALLRKDQVVVGLADPLSAAKRVAEMAERGVTAFGMELIPRITRAQSMDVLSSMATIAGYKAVLIAASRLPRCFPMFMTAAGTIKQSRVFVIGAGVAGLQAIATAKRLGAVVSAYDVRPEVREQVESVGGRFVQLAIEGSAGDKNGYAQVQDEAFYARQRELMGKVVAESDAVITTAAIPGRKAPILVTTEMVNGMAPGSVIVDLAAERGGNCDLTQAGVDVDYRGVTIIGPVNLPSTVPYHASQMYARNIATFIKHLMKDKALNIDLKDEITSGTIMCRGGEIVNPRLRSLVGGDK